MRIFKCTSVRVLNVSMLRFIQSLSLKLRYGENGKMVKIFTAVVCFRSFFRYRIACHRIQYWTSETIFSDPETPIPKLGESNTEKGRVD